MKYEDVDKARLSELVKAAKESGDKSSEELGRMVSNMCRIVLSVPMKDGKSFNSYSDDLKLEMMGNAVLAVYSTVENIDLSKDVFNYLYTVIVNSYKRTLKKFYRQPVSIDDEIINDRCEGDTNEIARENKLTMKGLFEMNESRVFMAGMSCKRVLLQTVLKNAVNHFIKGLSAKKIDRIIRMARKNREALC